VFVLHADLYTTRYQNIYIEFYQPCTVMFNVLSDLTKELIHFTVFLRVKCIILASGMNI
jgi:hypothetical protein